MPVQMEAGIIIREVYAVYSVVILAIVVVPTLVDIFTYISANGCSDYT